MSYVSITAASAASTVFRVVVKKPADGHSFGILMTSHGTSVHVRSIGKDSLLATEGGVRVGDVIKQVANKPCTSAKQVSTYIKGVTGGAEVEMLIQRPPPDQQLAGAFTVEVPKRAGDAGLAFSVINGSLCIDAMSEELAACNLDIQLGDEVLMINEQETKSSDDAMRILAGVTANETRLIVTRKVYKPPAGSDNQI